MAATAARKKEQISEGLARIEQLTQVYATHRQHLVDRMTKLDRELRVVKMRALAGIRADAAKVKDAQAELRAAIEANKHDFEKPRTRTFFGVKVGYRKLVGTISWEDTLKVVKLIKRLFPEQAEVLIKTTETPVKDSLAALPAADLKKLGVSVGEDTDEPVIKATDTEIDKVVDALLKERDDE